MSVAATENVTTDKIDAEQPHLPVTLVIDRFDHWHNQDAVLLRPTSITWGNPETTTVGRVA